jgi:phage-related protein
VHAGPPAESLAAEYGAHAFAYGSHIVLGRAAARAGDHARTQILAHELVHVVQQARAVPATAANDSSFDHRARAPPLAAATALVPLGVAPLAIQCLGEDDESIFPAVVGEAANTVAEFGVGTWETATELPGRATEYAVETLAGLVEDYAPGILEFLRGGVLGQLTDLFCSGIDTLIAGLFSALEGVDFMSGIESTFTALAEGVQGVQAAIGGAASAAVGTVLGPLKEALDVWGGPLIEAVQSISDTVNGVFTGLWDNVAVPALDFLESVGGAVWETFTGLVTWVWDTTQPLRALAEDAWLWLLDTFDLAWSSTEGIRAWLAEKASDAWDGFLETIEPIQEPLMTAGGILLLISPLGPIVVLSQIVPPLVEKITWLWNNWNSEDILVRAQDVLREDILPGIINTVSGVASAVAGAASWLAGIVAQFGNAMSGVLGAFGANRCLTAVTSLLNGIADQFTRLAAWAEGGFSGLSEALQAVFSALVAIFQPVLDFLVRLFMVAINPPLIPIALTAAIWLLCPEGLKPPVIKFVLGLLIAFIDGFPTFLPGLWPLASIIKAGTLGFLRQLLGEDVDDRLRVDASNKIAGLAAGGGIEFISGFALGLVEGVIDGIIDPFRIIYLIVKVIALAAQAIGNRLAPLVLGSVPGAEGALIGYHEALGVPAPEAPTLSRVEPQETATDTAPGIETPATQTGELRRVGATPAARGPPEAGAAPEGAGAPQPATSPETGTEDSAAGLELGAPEVSDAEIAAEISPDIAADLGAGGAELGTADTDAEENMRSEIRSEGASVRGLARLLGDAWDWMIAGAESLGRRAANAFLKFILLPDFTLGNKIGFVAGIVLLEAALIYFSGGSYAVAKAGEKSLRIALRYLQRFLDIGGEILGLVGKALRPLRGPIMSGLGAARGFLTRFRLVRGLIERIEAIAHSVFRFSDEAAGAGRRGAAEAGEEAGETAGKRATRESAEEAADRAQREAGEAVTASTAREGAETAAERGAREAGEESGERAARETGETAGERGSREATERPLAVAQAAAIAAANDEVDTPVSILRAQLLGLRARYGWIRDFEVRLTGPGEYSIWMIASRTLIRRRYTILVTGTFTSRFDQGPPWKRSEADVGRHLGSGWQSQAGFLHGKPLPPGARPGMSTLPDFYNPRLNVAAEVKNWDLAMRYERMIDNIMHQAGGRVISLPGHAAAERWLFVELRGQSVGDLAQLAARIHRDLGSGSVYRQIHFILDDRIVRAI